MLLTAPARDSATQTQPNLYWRVRAALYQRVPGVVRFYDIDTLAKLVDDQGLTVIECCREPSRVVVLAHS